MMRPAYAVIGSILLATWSVAGSASTQNQTPDQASVQPRLPVFRDGVEIVSLSVTVTDRQGRFVTDLTRDDFVIYEDKQAQEIVSFRNTKTSSAEPIGLGLVLDVSGSMARQPRGDMTGRLGEVPVERFAELRVAVERLVRERLRRSDEVYIIGFTTDARIVQPWTGDLEKVVATIRRMGPEGLVVKTALHDAIAAALPVSQIGRHRKQVVLVVTDGEDNKSKTPRDRVVEMVRSSDVTVYILVVKPRQVSLGEMSLPETLAKLSQITDPTGGFTRSVDSHQQLEDAILQVGAELTNQYEIGVARRHADGRYHEFIVGVRQPNLVIRHRLGYVAAK